MTDQPIVSVVMPAYNQERFIEQAIHSVLGQDFGDWELIVIDDGSTDSTLDIARDLASDRRITIASQDNFGVSSARNRGIELAGGRYIAFLDADDFWPPNWLSTAVAALDREQNVAVLVGPRQYVDCSGRPLPQTPACIPPSALDLSGLVLSNPIFTSAVVLRRQCLERVGGFDEDLAVGEDWQLWVKLLRSGFRFMPVDHPLICYRIHDSNSTLQIDLSRDHLLAGVRRLFRESEARTPAARRLEARAYSRVYYHICRLALRSGDLESAKQDFRRAVQHDPSMVSELSTWFSIVCAGQPPGYEGTSFFLDLEQAEANLIALIGALYETDDQSIHTTCRRSGAMAMAYVALGRVSYALRHDSSTARGYFVRALAADVGTAVRHQSATYFVRTILGKRLLSFAKKLKTRCS